MTIEEAIKLLEIQKPVMGCKEYKKPLMTAYDMAIAAMEKQIPKKPFQDKDIYGTKYLLCRECSKILSFVGFVARYCPDCGQKIDWSGEDVN